MVRPLSLLFLAVLLVPGWVGALGLGEIKLSSRLNQPLQAEIPLYAVRPNDVEGMKIALADAAQFRRAGVERAFYLTQIRFTAEDNGDGTGRIRVTTERPVNEPFLNFLVEVDWQTGRLVREFTLLLDPPVYGAALRSSAARTVPSVTPSQPRQLSAPPAAALTQPQFTPPAPVRNAGPFANRNAGLQPELQGGTPAAPSVSEADTAVGGGTYGPVKRTDTLWSLASTLRPDRSVSVHQMMMAILNANPGAFANGNVNALRAGSILTVPSLQSARDIDQSAALAEIRRQNTQWQDIRRRIAANAATRPASAPVSDAAPVSDPRPAPDASTGSDEVAGGEAPASNAEQGDAAPAGEVVAASDGTLKIVGAGTGDAVGAGTDADIARLSEQVDLVREELELSRNETEDLKAKLDQAESIILDMERLAQIRDDQLAQLQQQLAQTQSALEQAAAQMDAASGPAGADTAGAATQDSTDSDAATGDRSSTPAAAGTETSASAQTTTPDDATTPAPSPTGEASTSEPSTSEASGTQTATAPTPGTQPAAPNDGVATGGATAAPADSAAKAPPPAAVPPPAPAPPPDMITQIMAMATSLDPSVLLGFGGAILAVLGLGWYRVRSKKQRAAASGETLEEVMLDNASSEGASAIDPEATQVSDKVPPVDQDYVDTATTAALFDEADAQTVAVLDEDGDDNDKTDFGATLRADQLAEDDPLQEANVYLAYERFDQAEEVVKGAIEAYPDRPEYRVKLLEIYHGMRNRAAFDGALVALQGVVAGDSDLLVRANELSETFPEAGAVDTGVDLDLGTGAATGDTQDGGVDFDLGFGGDDGVDAAAVDEDDVSTLDNEDSIARAEATKARAEATNDGGGTSVDFVLDSFDGGPAAPPALGASTDIDYGGSADGGKQGTSGNDEGIGGADTQVLDFDLAFGDTGTGGDEPEDPSEITTSVDIDLDMFGDADDADLKNTGADVTPPESAKGTYTEALDLDFDLDFGAESESTAKSDTATDTATMQEMVPEAFETVQLNLDTVEGNNTDDDAADRDTSDKGAAALGAAGLGAAALAAGELDLDFSSDDDSATADTDESDPSAAAPGDLSSDDLDFELPLDSSEETGTSELELPPATDEETVAFELDLDPSEITSTDNIALDLDGPVDEDEDIELTLGDDLEPGEPAHEQRSEASAGDDSTDVLMLDLDAALTADADATPQTDIEQSVGVGEEPLLELDESLLDADRNADKDDALQEEEIALDLPDDMSDSAENFPVQMPDEQTGIFEAAAAEPEDLDRQGAETDERPADNEGQDGASMVLDSSADEDTTELLSDVLLQEETVDTSELDLDVDFEDSELSESDFIGLDEAAANIGSAPEDDDAISLDLNLDDDDALDFDLGVEDSTDDEQTIEVDASDSDASDDDFELDLNFDPSDVPLEALDTQTHLGADLAEDEQTYQDLDTVILDQPSQGAGVDTTDLGPTETADDDGDELDFDLGDFGDDLDQTETVVGGSVVPEMPDESTELDLSDFDPLAAPQTDAADSVPSRSDDPTIDFPLDDLGDVDDIDLADASETPTLGLGTIDDEDEDETLVLGNAFSQEVDAMQTKLDLAQEFAELGDHAAAREALQEVIAEGDSAQQQAARTLLESLPS